MPQPSAEGDGYFRTIVDTLPAPVCRWLADTTVTYANEAYARLIAGRSDLVGMRWLGFVPEARRGEVEAFYREWVRNPREMTFEHEVRGSDGATRWFSWMDTPIFGSDGEVVEFQSIGVDVTVQKEAEAERERIEARLRESHKMEAIGRLAGGVAHDFNNMLGIILGHVELALRRSRPSSPLHPELLEIQSAAQRSAELTRQLLTFARKQPISPEPLDLNEVVAGLLRMLRKLVGDEIELEWTPGEELGPVVMDPAQVDQLLVSLLVNAREAILRSTEGPDPGTGAALRGTISIGTRNRVVGDVAATDPAQAGLFPEEPEGEGAPPGRYVALTVRDDGPGIEPERLPVLFEPFAAAKQGRGRGLGLATVYGIVKQNGGFLRVDSEPGRGTTFELHLPRHEADGADPPGAAPPADDGAPEPEKEASTPARNGTPTVLLVEDERPVLLIVQRVLERLGYAVLTADDPEAALGIAENSEHSIDLLLTDVVMPGMSGPEVFDRLRRTRPQLRCLFMSGYPAEEIARHPLGPSVRFIAKPFSLEALEEEVRATLGGTSRG